MCWPSIFSQTTSESSTTAPSTPRSLAQTSSCRPRAALLTPPATSRLVLNTVTSCTCLLTPHQPAATATTTHPSSATCWRPSTHKSSRTSTLSLGAPSCRDTSTTSPNTFSATVRISYNPEFIQQGDIIRGFLNPDMVLIGEGCKEMGDHMVNLYGDVCENTPIMGRMAAESAEICKIAINCFITTKISYCNMVGDIADRTPGAEKNEILQAVGADSRIGTKCLRPGYGFGGPCFPRDNRALGGYAKSIGIDPNIPIATDEYNDYHTQIMIKNKLAEDKDEYTFSDVAYKPQCPVPIIEESQKLAVASGVAKAGKKVTIEDRDFIIACVRAEFGSLFEYKVL